MPIYEYRCPECREQFEVLQRVGEDGSKLICPQCGERGVEKIISLFSSAASEGSASGRSCSAGSGFT